MTCMPPRIRLVPLIAAASILLAAAPLHLRAQEKTGDDAALARQVRSATVSVGRGLSAARTRGTPISAKYELEDGRLQLSVYAARNGHFWEVVVDHKTGRIAEAKEIKDGEDLAAAKSQNEAMSKGKRSLNAVAALALKSNPGSRVVSVIPSVDGGQPVAAVRLVKGSTFKTVSEALN